MISEKVLATALVATADGAAVAMDISPFVPRHKVQVQIQMTGFSGTVLIEGSDTGTFTGEETTLFTTGAQTTEDRPLMDEIVLPRFVRHSTTRSAGTVDFIKMISGI